MLFFPAIVSIMYHASLSGSPNPAYITIEQKVTVKLESREYGGENVNIEVKSNIPCVLPLL